MYDFIFQTLVYSMKDDMRDLAANLYGVIVCNQSHDERIREALDDFYSALSDKVLPVDYGKCSKMPNMFLFLFSNKIPVYRARIHKSTCQNSK